MSQATLDQVLAALRAVEDISAKMTGTGREATLGLRLYDAVHPVLTQLTGNPSDWETRQPENDGIPGPTPDYLLEALEIARRNTAAVYPDRERKKAWEVILAALTKARGEA